MRIYDYLICAGPEGVVTLGAAFILGTKEIMKEHIQECFDGGEVNSLTNQKLSRLGEIILITGSFCCCLRLEFCLESTRTFGKLTTT